MNTDSDNNKLDLRDNSKNFKSWNFSSMNYLLFIFGIIIISLGYVIMATGEVNSSQSLSIAPVLLFIGYIVLIPLSLIIDHKDN